MNRDLFFTPKSLVYIGILIGTFSPVAKADDLHIWAEEAGGNVVFYYEGSIDTTGFSMPTTDTLGAGINPFGGNYLHGRLGAPFPPIDEYSGVIPGSDLAKSFGDGGFTSPSSVTGDAFAYIGTTIALPENYVSGSPISGTMTFTGATLSSLGVNGTPKTFDTAVGTNTIHVLVDPNPVADNSAARAELMRKIGKLQKKSKKLKKKGKKAKAKKLGKKVKKLKSQLAALG